MITPLSQRWWNPTKVAVAVFGGALVLDSVFAVWGERRPVGGFFEELIARSGHYVVIFGAFFGAVCGASKANKKSNSKVVGWIVGIALFALIGVGGGLFLSSIPGVDWRYDRLNDSIESEY